MFVGEGASVPFFNIMRKKFGLKNTYRIALLIYSFMNLFCYFSTNLWLYILFFLVMGFSYNLCLIVASKLIMQLLPDKPGQSTFLGTIGVSLSPIIIGYLIQYLVNPENLKPEIEVYEGSKLIKYFGIEIAYKLPTYFIIVAIYCFFGATIISFFIYDPDSKDPEKGVNLDQNKNIELSEKNQNLQPLNQIDNEIDEIGDDLVKKEYYKASFWYLFLSIT